MKRAQPNVRTLQARATAGRMLALAAFAAAFAPFAANAATTVTIATLRSEQRAAAVAAQLVEAGFPAFTRRHPDGVSHQVIVGPYTSAEEAMAVQPLTLS